MSFFQLESSPAFSFCLRFPVWNLFQSGPSLEFWILISHWFLSFQMSPLSAFDVLIDFWHLPPSCTADQWIVVLVNAQMSTEIKSIRLVETFNGSWSTEQDCRLYEWEDTLDRCVIFCLFTQAFVESMALVSISDGQCEGAKRVSRGWTGLTATDVTCHHHLIENGWLLF